MARRIIFQADLKTGRFKRGTREMERHLHRLKREMREVRVSALRMRRGFSRVFSGQFKRGFVDIGNSAMFFGKRIASAGSMAFASLGAVVGVLRKLIGFVGDAIRKATIFGGVLATVAGMSIKTAAAFEAQVEAVAALSDATPGQRESIRNKALEIGVKTPLTIMDIAQGQEGLARRGFKPDEINKLADAASKLAIVGRTDFTTAATSIAQVMQQFQLPATQADKVASMLGQTLKNTALGADDLVDAMKQAGAVANLANLDLAELLAVLGRLQGVLQDPSMASTAVRNMVLILSTLQTKSTKSLENQFGLSPEEAGEFAMIGGSANSLLDVVQNIGERFKDNQEVLLKIFGKRTSGAVLQLAADIRDGLGRDGFGSLIEKINDSTSFLVTFERFLGVTDAKLKQVVASAQAVQIEIGSKLTEAFGLDEKLSSVTGFLEQLREDIAGLTEEQVASLKDTLAPTLFEIFEQAVQFWVGLMVDTAPVLGEIMYEAVGVFWEALTDQESAERRRNVRALGGAEMGRIADPATIESIRTKYGAPTTDDLSPPGASEFKSLWQMWHGVPKLSDEERRAVDHHEMAKDILERRTRLQGIGQAYVGDAKTRVQALLDGLGSTSMLQNLQTSFDANRRDAEETWRQQSAQSGPKPEMPRHMGAAIDLRNFGVQNVYSAPSGSARAKPMSSPGQTRQDAKGRR